MSDLDWSAKGRNRIGAPKHETAVTAFHGRNADKTVRATSLSGSGGSQSSYGGDAIPASSSSVQVTASTATGAATAAVALGADAATSGSGLTGAGVKIGIVSDSFDALGTAGADESDGALPAACRC